jgi:hypothetical protein
MGAKPFVRKELKLPLLMNFDAKSSERYAKIALPKATDRGKGVSVIAGLRGLKIEAEQQKKRFWGYNDFLKTVSKIHPGRR